MNNDQNKNIEFFSQHSIKEFIPGFQIYLKPQLSKAKISLLMPPPNITGKLHLGHALNNFIQDAIIRWNRIQEVETLWIPGFDHAGIATEVLVNKWIKKNRLAPKNLIQKRKYFESWAKEKQETIRKQWTNLNLLINPEKERFTLDQNFKETVTKAFVSLYNEGLIYQEKKLVNWDCTLETAISNIEVEHREIKGKIYFFKYKLAENDQKHVSVATTRPETMFVDCALFVNSHDERYKKIIGKFVINPINDQKIPILSDETINPDFGTGVVKCTPAHDFFDFNLAIKNNLKPISVLNHDGTLNELSDEFNGIDRLEAREKIIKKLDLKNAFVKEEQHIYSLPISSRSNSVIEPLLTNQWFLKTKQWAQDLQKKKNQIHFIPKKYENYLWNWLKNIQDWCISRQLTWGHQLPIYQNTKTKKIVASETELGDDWIRSEDVLDTWFSSGLWTLVNFDWKNESSIIKSPFFPITCLVTSYDIIFFWVARMLFLHHHFTKQIPFNQVLIHGLIRTKDNQKMSKSKGNAIAPDELIKKYGSGALRFYLLSNYKIGEDLIFDEDKLIQSAQFVNKLINIDQFIEKNLSVQLKIEPPDQIEEPINLWIMEKFENLRTNVEKNYEQKLFSFSLQKIIQFIWKDFSNFYLRVAWSFFEQNISVEETKKTMNWIWSTLLIFLHPFMPQVTYYLWVKRTNQKMALSHFPKIKLVKKFSAMINVFFKVLQAKEENSEKFQGNTKIIYQSPSAEKISENDKNKLNAMLFPFQCEIVSLVKDWEQKIIIQKSESTDELDRTKIEKELARTEKLLANEDFVNKANPEIVEKEREKKKKYKDLLKDKI